MGWAVIKQNSFSFLGGHPTLDFINTVVDQDKDRGCSSIAQWEHFLEWVSASGMFTDVQIKAFHQIVSSAEQEQLLKVIHKLREKEYAVLSDIAMNGFQPNKPLLELESKIKEAIGRASLSAAPEGYQWQPDMAQKLWIEDAFLFSFEQLLRSQELKKLKECGRCSWLFLDKGRGRGRRWCDMSTCGNRAKLASFRNRAREEG